MRRKLALLLLRRFRAAPGLAAIGALTTLGLIVSWLQLSFVRRGAVEQHTCIGFIETKGCLPYGERLAVAPRPCAEVIKGAAGYCLCNGNVTVNRVECGAPPFSCRDRCGKAHVQGDAEQLPEPITCGGDEGAVTAAVASSAAGGSWQTLPVADVAALDEQAASTWHKLQQLTAAAAPDTCPPAPRTSRHDWVLRGWHMPGRDVQQARQRWQGFLQQLPEFPAHLFRGRGVVLVGGGPKYLVPAWLGISYLRRWGWGSERNSQGCQLPIEVWFPPSERPPAQVVEQLQLQGATSRILPAEGEAGRPGSWFGLKALALLLSSFQEVLFLDADNLPLADPSHLFEADVYRSAGNLLWQDYWQSTVSTEMLQIVGVDGSMTFPGSFESGQMILDKRRTWHGLLAAAYFNVHYYLFHNLLSCYMGQGDKETFAMGILATGGALAVVPSPPGSVGVLHPLCERGWRQSKRGQQHARSCPQQFLGNSMMQYDLQGQPLFLHTNLKPKLNLAMPNDFKHYNRRWKWMEPEHRSFQDWSKAGLDMDLEQTVWQALKQLRCLPALASYWKEHEEATGAGRGLHPVPLGVNFNSMYGWGLRGCFERWTRLRIVDRLNHALHTAGARVLGWTVDWVARSAAQGRCL